MTEEEETPLAYDFFGPWRREERNREATGEERLAALATMLGVAPFPAEAPAVEAHSRAEATWGDLIVISG